MRLVATSFVFAVTTSAAAAFAQTERDNYGQRLETITGKVIHGAGQDYSRSFADSASFTSMIAVLNGTGKPVRPAVFMTYLDLSKVTPTWGIELKQQLLGLSSDYVIPHIGLGMSDDQLGNSYDNEVAAGAYDKEISFLAKALSDLGRPAYLRIGYEFNGPWNGYGWNNTDPATFAAAFQRIATGVRARGLDEVATVWNASLEGHLPLDMTYYPGDGYVDWWGVNIFDAGMMRNAHGVQFLADARAHRKPVMIGESTPRGTGVLNGQASWDAWFQHYFRYIAENPGIKMFNYINWDWKQHPPWNAWGDARLQSNATVASNYANAVENSLYFNGSTNVGGTRTELGLPAVPPSGGSTDPGPDSADPPAPWVYYGGSTYRQAAPVLYNGHTYVFATGTNQFANRGNSTVNLIYFQVDETGWAEVPWHSTGRGASPSKPAPVVDAHGRLRVYVQGTDNLLYANILDGANWTGWIPVDHPRRIRSGPSAVLFNGHVYVFSVDGPGAGQRNYNVIYKDCDSASTGWMDTGVQSFEAPSLGTTPNLGARALIARRGLDNRIYYGWWSGSTSVAWAELPSNGRAISAPAVAVDPSGVVRVFVVGTDNAIWRNTRARSGSWTDWELADDTIHTHASVGVLPIGNNITQLFVSAYSKRIFHRFH